MSIDPPPTDTRVRIGTRASQLALTQTGWVAERIRALGATVELERISTRGDVRHAGAPPGLGGDGVFVRELEHALREGRIDVAVHSLKDLPTAETAGLEIAAVPRRALAFDALVAGAGKTLRGLPPGAVVGTSSVRRVAQVRALRPDLVVRPIRGNVDTRLAKLDAGEYDALVLAGAGLERLGLADRITEVLRPPDFWPAVGQGALAIQIRADDGATRRAVAPLDDPATHLAVRAERACLASLAGGCLAPIGAWARFEGGVLALGGCVLEIVGDKVSRIMVDSGRSGQDEDHVAALPRDLSPELIGRRAAAALEAMGAGAMLEQMRVQAAATLFREG
jgi:hydroxymethylbilane synthase